MLQPSRELDLADEPLDAFASAQLRAHHLHRHHPLVADVPGQIDGSHTTGPDLPLEHVALAEGCRQRARNVTHGSAI
jgi:hypothetical protein